MKTVMCFGDSNTFGTPPMKARGEDRRFEFASRWPNVMGAALGAGYKIIAEGHPGRTTVFDDPIEGIHRNGSRILLSLIESHRPVDLLIVMLGTNDQKNKFGLNAADIAGGAGGLVEIAQASGYVKDVLLIAPPKVLERGCLAEIFEGAETRSESLSNEMKAEADYLGVDFIDAAEIIESDPLDGVHFNEASHKALGEAVARKVLAIQSSCHTLIRKILKVDLNIL